MTDKTVAESHDRGKAKTQPAWSSRARDVFSRSGLLFGLIIAWFARRRLGADA